MNAVPASHPLMQLSRRKRSIFLTHGDDGDDETFAPDHTTPDVDLHHDDPVSLNELHDLHLDRLDDDDHSVLSTASDSEEERNDDSANTITSDDDDDESTASDDESTASPLLPAPEKTVITEKTATFPPGMTTKDHDTERGAAHEEQNRGATIQDQERGAAAPINPAENETNHSYNLRARTDKTETTKFNEQFDNPASSQSYAPHLQFFQNSVSGMVEDPQRLHNHLCDYSFNQMSEKDGIAKHGQDAVTALFKEFAQLHDKRVLKVIKASDLTGEQKRNALHAINLIKEKRNDVLKGRIVADGRKQLMALLTVSATERRKIISWDVEGAYLLADQDDYVLVKFTGESVNVLCDVDNSYRQYVTIEKRTEGFIPTFTKGTLRVSQIGTSMVRTIHKQAKRNGFLVKPL